MNGRRYSEASPPVGTQSRSMSTRASTDSMNSSVGSSAIARRRAERWNRSALAAARKVAIDPSGWR